MKNDNFEDSLESELNGGAPAGTADSENNQDKGGSQEIATPAKIKLADGREVTGEELKTEYEKLHGEFTRKSQELSKLNKTKDEAASEDEGSKELTPTEQAAVKELKRLGFVTKDQTPSGENTGEIVNKVTKQVTSNIKLEEALDDLVTDYPFVKKDAVMDFLAKINNPDLTLEQVATALYPDEFVKAKAKQMIGETGNVPQTEGAGAGQNGQPPTPKVSFKDNSIDRALENILVGGN